MRILLFILGFILCFSASFAERYVGYVEITEYWEPSHFSSTSVPVNYDFNNQCINDIKKVSELYTNYHNQSLQNSLFNKWNKKLQSKLEKLKSQKPLCYAQAFEYLAIAAAMNIVKTKRSEDAFKIQILAALQRTHIIHEMTQEVRDQYKKFSDPKVKGGISCLNKNIWLDPTLEPLNLGLVLLHELQHLLWSAQLYKHPQFLNLNLSEKESAALDESIASIFMAHTNMSARDVYNRDLNNNEKNDTWFKKLTYPVKKFVDLFFLDGRTVRSAKTYLDTQKDLMLIEPQGGFYQIWSSSFNQGYGWQSMYNFKEFLSIAQSDSNRWSGLFKKIHGVYFEQDENLYLETLQNFAKLKSSNLDILIDPFEKDFELNLDQLKCLSNNVSTGERGGEGGGLEDTNLRLEKDIKACHLGLEL